MMEGSILFFVKLLLFSMCTNGSIGQRTAKSSCPNADNNCDGVPHVVLEHNFKIDSLGTAVRDLLSWKQEIHSHYNKEIITLKEEITALKNKSSEQETELAALNNKSSEQETELAALNNKSSKQETELTALRQNIVVLNDSKQDQIEPENCAEVYKYMNKTSGVYTLTIRDGQNNVHQVPVYCDMDTSTGGWTVFQRRQDGSVPFNRTWEEYKRGFGNLHSEFWLGNQWIAMMTASNTKYTLRIDLESFDNEKRYAEYKDFKINGEADKFRLNIGSYSGTAGDGGRGLSYQNQSQFSTKDSDNDGSSGNCALTYGEGGFWYKDCHHVNLNGVYRHTAISDTHGIRWYAWLSGTTLKHTEMKLKPLQ